MVPQEPPLRLGGAGAGPGEHGHVVRGVSAGHCGAPHLREIAAIPLLNPPPPPPAHSRPPELDLRVICVISR